MARPKLEIDPKQVQKLAALHCTTQEIADFFDCSRDTIERRFAAEMRAGRASGKIGLRRLQWQSAERGSTDMQKFLGKNYLSQSDKPEEEVQTVKEDVSKKPMTLGDLAEVVKLARGSG